MLRSLTLITSIFLIGWGNAIFGCLKTSSQAILPEPLTADIGYPSISGNLMEIGPGIGPSLVEDNQIHGLYFYAEDCSHCFAALEEVINPLESKYGSQLDIRLLEIGNPDNYELLIAAEEYFKVDTANRQIPVLIIGEDILIGEQEVRDRFPDIVEEAGKSGGIGWPSIPGLDPETLFESESFFYDPITEICGPDEQSGCDTSVPIYIAFFYKVGCQDCSRVKTDLNYIRARYPQVIIEEFNIYDYADLAEWLAKQIGQEIVYTPAIFIGNDSLVGDSDITPQAIEGLIIKYQQTGTTRIWDEYYPDELQGGILEKFRSMGWMAIVFAGLVDGLNPCAFATLIFFVSYLTLSGRKGREVLAVGGAFTLGVFLAYLAVGIGFYKVLELLGSWLTILGKWVYGLTAVLCFGLAIFAFRDFLKARKGNIADMELNLPHFLRMRINSIIRQGRNQRVYIIGAFATGVIISFLELACTGQIYLPTIIFMRSVPSMQLRANFFLLLYNILFILPLVIVFILAYLGTGSKDLSRFLEKNAAIVKLGMVLLFLSLGIWLTISVIG